ncbi:hypothetical protein PUN28_014604 [Cardiocondyla obscurior]|uniref:Uncharacterized protein n=1 Tax=Cardiocondyla obscurior TaxID=286306 RepID=A0AAW2F6A0_9HYME
MPDLPVWLTPQNDNATAILHLGDKLVERRSLLRTRRSCDVYCVKRVIVTRLIWILFKDLNETERLKENGEEQSAEGAADASRSWKPSWLAPNNSTASIRTTLQRVVRQRSLRVKISHHSAELIVRDTSEKCLLLWTRNWAL